MRRIMLLLLLLVSLPALSANKKKPKPMPVSRWKEVKRMKSDSSVVTFTDTMFISFRPKDSFEYHSKNGFIYKGGYTINEDSLLDFGTARYRIKERRPASLVLINDLGIYHFNRDSSDTAKIIVATREDSVLPVTNIDQMIGHWTVYKRSVKENSSGTIDNAVTIRSVYISGPSTDGRQGLVFSGSDPSNQPSWYIKSYSSDQILDCDGKNHRILKVVKCQKGELILEGDDIKYFLKQFK